jgi:hypothetical protein
MAKPEPQGRRPKMKEAVLWGGLTVGVIGNVCGNRNYGVAHGPTRTVMGSLISF